MGGLAGSMHAATTGRRRRRGALTTPQAKQVLGVARLNGVHRAVLDAHNGQLCSERHRDGAAVVCARAVLIYEWGRKNGAVVVVVPLASGQRARALLRQSRRRAGGQAGEQQQ